MADHLVEREITAHDLHSAISAQLRLMKLTGQKLVEEYRIQAAKCLLEAGGHLIPSDHLLDHQIVVSRGVYNAAKKLIE